MTWSGRVSVVASAMAMCVAPLSRTAARAVAVADFRRANCLGDLGPENVMHFLQMVKLFAPVGFPFAVFLDHSPGSVFNEVFV